MTDNELGILLRDQILAGLTRQSVSLPVVMAYQSQTEGRVNGTAAYYCLWRTSVMAGKAAHVALIYRRKSCSRRVNEYTFPLR